MHNDVNKTSAISIVTAFDSTNYYITYNFEQCDLVYIYVDGEYINVTPQLNNNKIVAEFEKSEFSTVDSKAYFKLIKDGLPRYATVTVYAENGALKYEPVLYSNTPFS